MARIRTVKPEFFRHEALQDLEIEHPGKYLMMVFQALWGHCDSKGRFEWRPRTLKLDILPFLPFDMATTLEILEAEKLIYRYEIDGKEYGEIRTFNAHQRLSGKELTEGEKHPAPTFDNEGKHRGSVREIPESQEGKGREEEGKGVKPTAPPKAAPCPTQKIIDLFPDRCPSLIQPRVIPDSVKGMIADRWRQDAKHQELEFWVKFFDYCESLDFLTGRTSPTRGEKAFRVGIEWIVKAGNFAKIINGNYVNG